ncbi:alpha/beta fold hydrolase [Bacillus dakarensis]|uniref:alpha/beta fold hydrolase n=1 Tax=Robertmurraya dakarensis TaxID=1926278 RepID=UPI000981DD4E|nr:alpha/beta fold hydrolase [Bacillus dakarensis]
MGSMKLLFIHGAGGTKSKWRAIDQYIADKFTCEKIDLPGHGDNEYNAITSIQDYASYVTRDIHDDTIVVGHSMGGLVALELAARNPKVKGVILAASFYELPVHPKLLEQLANDEFPESLFHASYGKDTDSEILQVEKEELKLVPIGVTYADFRATNQYKEGLETLKSLKIPVYAILGSEDRLLPKGAVEAFEKEKPDMKVCVIEGAGHYVMVEKPEAFCEKLVEFVRETEKN